MAPRIVLDSLDLYTVAWISSLPSELAAAKAMLDEEHAAPAGFTQHRRDNNLYIWGRVGEHNIVIAAHPAVDGAGSAAATALSLLTALPSIQIRLLVGIGSGIARPGEGRDIRLGDVVVSQPNGTTGGVCQYDSIEAKAGDRRQRWRFLVRPPTVLLHALTYIQANHRVEGSKIPDFLQAMLDKYPNIHPGYTNQGSENDRLFRASRIHVPGPDCRRCDAADEVPRKARATTNPYIHYGIIASGRILFRDAVARDQKLADVEEDCICLEIAAAGRMDHIPCLVIRGISDYADSHGNDRWQHYASATAAAYAKELLGYVPGAVLEQKKRASEVLESAKAATESINCRHHTNQIKRWLHPTDPSINADNARWLRLEGTGSWFLQGADFQSLLSGARRNAWLHGVAGCGKTILSASVLDHLGNVFHGLVLSFFFRFDDETKQTVDRMLRSLAFQLYKAGAGPADLLDGLFQEHQDGQQQPTTQALQDVVFQMLAASDKCFIVLDALDESSTRGQVVLWMENLMSRQELGHVQLICTGRPEPEFLRDIPRLFGQESCVALDKQAIDDDIRLWVAAQLSERADFQNKSLSKDIVERITNEVGDGADGRFRWAACQLDILAQCPHLMALDKVLASLPSLDETYTGIIENMLMRHKHDM